MSEVGIRASISTDCLKISRITTTLPENFRLRDLGVIPVGTNVRPANESHSPLSVWISNDNPFSNRQLMSSGREITRKKSLEPSVADELNQTRQKFTPDGYANIIDVVATVANVNQEIGRNKLSDLTVREKNAFQERLGLYEEHFKRVLTGFSNARFPEDVKVLIDRVQGDVQNILRSIHEQRHLIKQEINPSLADLHKRRLYV